MRYSKQDLDGLEIYINRSLMRYAPETVVSLGGFWIFRWLKVEGLHSPPGCAI